MTATLLAFPRPKSVDDLEALRRAERLGARMIVGDMWATADRLLAAAAILAASPDHCDAMIGREVRRVVARAARGSAA